MIAPHAPSRRELLLASGALFAWTYMPKLARAEGRDPRFLTIVLRGALDGLAAVAPVGDPDWVSLRGDNALTLDSKTSALKLDDFFALNPAMPKLHRMFKANDTILRLLDLYRHTDVNFARVLEGRTKLTAIAPAGSMDQKPTGQTAGPDLAQLRAYFSEAVGTAARFLAQPDGPRVGALALNGWDT